MIIHVQRDAIKKAVSSVRKALSKVVIQEERGHLLFKVSGNTMSVQGTNNDLKALCIVGIENDDGVDFDFTTDPKILDKLLSKIDSSCNVRVEFDPQTLVMKVYTTDTGKSFSSLQSFPADKMLTVGDTFGKDRKEYTVDRSVLDFTLNYAKNYLADVKDDQKQYDFVVIDKGIVFAANGSNKMGFVVFKAFENFEVLKIRKTFLPLMISFMGGIEGSTVKIIETDRDTGICSEDGKMFFTSLKSTVEPPNIPKEYIKSEGPYTTINKDDLLKVSERLLVSSGSSTGIEMSLCSTGADAYLELTSIANLKSTERVKCSRVNDPSGDDVKHVLDFRLLKAVLTSFDCDKDIRMHINDDKKFFKVYNGGEVNGQKYILAGIGTYAKIVRQ